MFLDELTKDLQKVFLMKDYIAGWQNKPGKVDVMIIGTAPGMTGAVINRKPLSGSHSGKLLWSMIRQTPLNQKTIYITNLIKYPLRNNREPTEGEINENKPVLNQEILKYNPKIVICLGKHAMMLFGLRTYQTKTDEFGIKFVSINHPGYYLRKPSQIQTAVIFLKEHSLSEENL